MKCPKCGYLGFEAVDRCRNCGYDFSLARAATIPELPIRSEASQVEPLEDLALLDAAAATPPPPARRSEVGQDLDRMLGEADPGGELPLFGPPIVDDMPLITRVSPPRPPLAVRRATPEVPRLRSEQPRFQPLDLGLDLDALATSPSVEPGTRAQQAAWPRPPAESEEDAALGSRALATVIDLAILAAIDLAVIYFTMQICGITLGEFGVLPKGPLIAFLLVQNGGYLVSFTAGGQTLGKMAAGIKVVTAGRGAPLDVSRALLRTLMWFVLAVPAGLGFLTALFSHDHRGLHDRFAGTRVVRASAN